MSHEIKPVSPRYSFMDRELLRLDWLGDQGMMKVRTIEYPKPEGEKKIILKAAQQQGLVLGSQVKCERSDHVRYAIPTSARPIEHDASVARTSEFSYGDEAMFKDLGAKLKLLADIDERNYQIQGDVVRHVAFVEFTRKDESKLFFVPGFEEYTAPFAGAREDMLHGYVRNLSQSLGARFERNVDAFARGFDG